MLFRFFAWLLWYHSHSTPDESDPEVCSCRTVVEPCHCDSVSVTQLNSEEGNFLFYCLKLLSHLTSVISVLGVQLLLQKATVQRLQFLACDVFIIQRTLYVYNCVCMTVMHHPGVLSQMQVTHTLGHVQGSRVMSSYEIATVEKICSKVLPEEQVFQVAFLSKACIHKGTYTIFIPVTFHFIKKQKQNLKIIFYLLFLTKKNLRLKCRFWADSPHCECVDFGQVHYAVNVSILDRFTTL